MDLGLADKVAIVGGASDGIGFAIASLLAREGVHLAMVARRKDKLEAAAQRIRDRGCGRLLTMPADIRKGEDCERIIASTKAEFGGVDLLVVNDGAPPIGPLLEFDDQAWARAVDQNLMSVVRLTRGAVPMMKARGGGRIVSITALSALQPIPHFGLSVATWAAAMAYSKTLSLEVARDGITVNTICPGRIATGRVARVFGSDGQIDDATAEKMAKEIPVGRIGQPDELASLAVYLLSGPAAFITGAAIQVDGGKLGRVM
jgi:3-oxoacyl-[acyl-carrier protein] reductase